MRTTPCRAGLLNLFRRTPRFGGKGASELCGFMPCLQGTRHAMAIMSDSLSVRPELARSPSLVVLFVSLLWRIRPGLGDARLFFAGYAKFRCMEEADLIHTTSSHAFSPFPYRPSDHCVLADLATFSSADYDNSSASGFYKYMHSGLQFSHPISIPRV